MAETNLIKQIRCYADKHNASSAPLQTGVEGFTIVRSYAPTTIEPMIYKPLVCVVLQGSKVSFLHDQAVTFDAGKSLIVSLNLPTVSRITQASREKPYIALALDLDLKVIRSLHEEIYDHTPTSGPAQAIVSGNAEPALIDAMGRLFSLIDKPVDRAVLFPLIQREIHFHLLRAEHGEMLRRLAFRESHASKIEKTLTSIRKDYTLPLSVSRLADDAGMSISNFHKHFKLVTSTTPLQYQKDIRLLNAKEKLLDGERSITEVAFAVGYESPAQFSREYARKFGASPREDRIVA